jgi:hypothetical protein
MLLGFLFAADASSRDGWKLLFENKPVEAIDVFNRSISSGSDRDVAEAFRGLATAEMFLGKFDHIPDYILSATEYDRDIAMASSRPDALILSRVLTDKKKRKKLRKRSQNLRKMQVYSAVSIRSCNCATRRIMIMQKRLNRLSAKWE